MNYFSDFTRQAVQQHDFNQAKKCFALAEKIYRQGDRLVRLLIENIFVYSFTSFMPNDKTERIILKSLIPDTLYTLYIRQATQPGC